MYPLSKIEKKQHKTPRSGFCVASLITFKKVTTPTNKLTFI